MLGHEVRMLVRLKDDNYSRKTNFNMAVNHRDPKGNISYGCVEMCLIAYQVCSDSQLFKWVCILGLHN